MLGVLEIFSRWTSAAVACMQWKASVSLCFVGDSQRTFHFAWSVALLQLSSDSALLMSWLPGFSETGNWAARWHSLLQALWDVAGGFTLLWASTVASALSVPLTGIQEPGRQSPLPTFWSSWPLEDLGRGQSGLQVLQVIGSWTGRIFVSACGTSPTCKSGS